MIFKIEIRTEFYIYYFTYFSLNNWLLLIAHVDYTLEHYKDYFYRASDGMTKELRKMLDKNKNIIHNKTLLIKYVTDFINNNEDRLLEEQKLYFGPDWLV